MILKRLSLGFPVLESIAGFFFWGGEETQEQHHCVVFMLVLIAFGFWVDPFLWVD